MLLVGRPSSGKYFLLLEENSSRHYKLLPVTLNKVILYKSATPLQLNSSATVGYMKKTTYAAGRETRQRQLLPAGGHLY
jgi:hypothetical protein